MKLNWVEELDRREQERFDDAIRRLAHNCGHCGNQLTKVFVNYVDSYWVCMGDRCAEFLRR